MRYFAREGAIVAGCGRSARSVDTLRRELGAKHDFAAVDVANAMAVDQWAAGVIERMGAPLLLLNNAAVIARNAPLWEVPPEEIDAVLSVNLRGVINVLRGFLPAMISAKRGVIVNFSSG